MANVICLICLRTDITAVKIATELADFVDELCDYNIIENPRYKYCTICAHLLKKFYNFQQRCLKACMILKSLKGRPKVLPTNLHKQIPSSIGPCSSLARIKVLEDQHDTDTDLLETISDLNNEANTTPNNVENTDPTLQDHIQVKDDPMHDVLDPDTDTTQVADGKNIYMITTSNGYLTIDSSFKKNTESIKLEADEEELNTNKDVSKNNANQSKINDYLKSFEDEIKDFGDNSVDSDSTEIKDTTFMLNNDPLRDDESLNSMDDIESDISDCDIESLPMDEEDSEPDSDLENLSDILEKAKNKKININEINDLELAEILLKIDRKNKLLKKRVQFLKDKEKIKDGLLKFFKNDEYDLGDGVKVSKESFLKIYDRCERSSSNHFNTFNFKDTSDKEKTDAFLRTLHKLYNPEYGTVFDIEYLDTEQKKLEEFNRRKDTSVYQSAPYKCERCYKGFQIERLHAYHMKKHDESSGAHECHICSVRFHSAARRRAHASFCHSAVYSCRLCHITIYYFASMLNHFNLHKGVEFPCPICNGIYRTSTGLSNHKRTHVTSHICTTCARSFVSEKGLLIHRRIKHQFNSEDARPRALCCLCYRKLLGCNTFSQMAVRSENIFNQLLYNGLEPTHEEITKLNLGMEQRLPIATTQLTKDNTSNESSHVMFKDEPMSVKEEVTTEDPLVEFEFYPEDCTEVELKFEEESDDYRNYPNTDIEETKPNDSNMTIISQKTRKSLSKYNETDYTVNVCDRKIYTSSPLDNHKTTQADEKPFSCHICDKQFCRKKTLVCHMRTHTGEKPFACNICNKHFNQKVNLVAHMRTHTGEKPYACSLCDKQYSEKSNLVAHVRTHTGEKPFGCNLCEKRFNQKHVLVRHMRITHTGEKSFACHVCNEQFERNMFLVDHMTTHPGEKPFACIVCKKQFNHRNILAAHIRTHTGEKPFSCNLCDKSFSQKANLVGHMKTHTGDKTLACHVCKKLFYKKNVLVDHMRTHPGEKPFACDVCDKKFTGSNSLIRHKRTHTGENKM